jgi:hypothetical protein
MACGVRTIENVAEVIHRGLTFDLSLVTGLRGDDQRRADLG